MTKSEWETSTDPASLFDLFSGKASPRKLRLIVVASCREMSHLLSDHPGQHGIEVAERLADHSATDAEVTDASMAIELMMLELAYKRQSALSHYYDEASLCGGCGCGCEAEENERVHENNPRVDPEVGYRAFEAASAAEVAGLAAEAVCHALVPSSDWRKAIQSVCKATEHTSKSSLARLSDLMRDILGPPRSVIINPHWRTSTSLALAQGIYTDRAFDRLPILADALEDAGCDNADILNHCRQPGEHVRGCWVVDLILGKE
jgi:hypothetical protein